MNLLQDIQLLMKLQDIDITIYNKEQYCLSLPILCKEKEQECIAIQKEIEEVEEKIILLKKQELRLLESIETTAEALRNKKNMLILITEHKEYNSLIKEIDTLEKSNRIHEEEKLLLYEELSIQQERLQELHTRYEGQKKDFESTQNELQPTIEEFAYEKKIVSKEREMLIKKISPPMYERYEFIRNRIPYPILSCINQGICSACRIVLPSQISVNVSNAQQIYTCPSCQRILYINEI